MGDSQGGGALESHPYIGGNFGGPPKDHYSPVNNNGNHPNGESNGLDLHSDPPTHLTLLKNAPASNSSSSPNSNTNSSGLPSFTSFGDTDGLGSRLSDAFSEIRYAELQHWDLNPYSTEGLTARLIDTRSIDSEHGPDHYRPWEKPDPNTAHQSPTSSTTSNNANGATPVTSENAISSTNSTNDKSPTTLTPLTNVFPAFAETFTSNGQKLPSFQSQFNPFQEPTTIAHTLQNHIDTNGTSSLPSFHTLPANRGYVHTPTHTPIHPVAHGPGMGSQPHHHQPTFLEERHIQIFPGQVQIGPGQFGQLIATTTAAQPTMSASTNGHHIHHHFNGNGLNGGGGGSNFNGLSVHSSTPSPAVPPPPVSTPGGTIQLQELVPVPPMHTLLHPSTLITTNNNTNKLQQTTDGNLPGLNLNIIHHDPHHGHHPPPHININMPKYLHGAGISQEHLHPIDGIKYDLIAVKYEHSPHTQVNPNMLHHHHQQQMPQHILHHHQNQPGINGGNGGIVTHHQITKLEQQQCSPQQIVTTNNNGGGTTNGNGSMINNGVTPNGTPKRTINRKRKGMELHHQGIIVDNNGSNHLSPHDLNDPQVSSVSSTDSNDYRRSSIGSNGINGNNGMNGNGHHHSLNDGVDAGLDKPAKKKRKRCGECIGCQRKDNCGDCAPCRNDKSHQICKMRRCDKLTEKKTPKVKLKQSQH